MAARNGAQFVEGLRQAPRETWISGRKVTDVTADPAFKRPVQAIADLYDRQAADPATMTCSEDGETFGATFLTPKSHADLVKRRGAMKVWADSSFGLVGRSPDYLNTIVMTWAEGADFFGQRGAHFADNVRNYYKLCRANDLFLTHAIVNPQSDRSRGSHQQDDAFTHLGVVEETKDGLIVRGAKMLATHGPTADELLVYPQPGIREGEERYVLAFGIPCATKGLKFICREPFDDGTQNVFDHPLGARFEEPDAVCVFDDVLVPWDRVFLYGDVKMGNALFSQASIRNHTGHQTAIRGLAKCQLITGIAVALTRAVKSDTFLHVQEQLGECLGYLQLIEGAIELAERKAEPTGRGAIRPAYAPLQSLRYHLPKWYERMVQVTQVLAAGGLLISPTEADLNSPVGPDIRKYYKGAAVEAEDRIRLFKLAWDATGTQFGQRMLQYERYYAGDPVRVAAGYYNDYDVTPLLDAVKRALAGAR
ncbi:MAG: 4-hydroxyphenylacetate 3-monooxygenase, oxygenase component [Alphaproteobacteria bacterium]|nr:4-hydroxyphenylacetate 3-monooxygenase, oxygenase component [Alphaproteobacteria bacterium]